MNNWFFFIVVLAMVAGCGEQDASEPDENTSPPEIEQQKPRTKRGRDSLSLMEYRGTQERILFEHHYEDKLQGKGLEFPHANPAKTLVYRIDCHGDCHKSEFDNRVSVGKEIPEADMYALVEILKDPKSYNQGTAACYEPKFGMVLYDENNVPTEFLNICMSCNSMMSYPTGISVKLERKHMYGFSAKAREQMRQLFLKWGLDYYGYSAMFNDDEEDYYSYLESKGDTATLNRLKSYDE
jgi:hypothetical protein